MDQIFLLSSCGLPPLKLLDGHSTHTDLLSLRFARDSYRIVQNFGGVSFWWMKLEDVFGW